MYYSDSDAYHSCYGLTGLSSVQHTWRVTRPEFAEMDPDIVILGHSLWTVEPCNDPGANIFDYEDRVIPVNPVYAIPADCIRNIKTYFAHNIGF